jgi:phospholipid transport system substrate-binding protein
MSIIRPASRRAVLGLALAGLVIPRIGWTLNAAPGDSPLAAPAMAQVVAPIQALNDKLVAVMRAGRQDSFRSRFHTLAPVIDDAFDLAAILRISVGLRWGDLEAAQQASLAKVFRRFTVASYVANFDTYAGERFEIAPTLRAIGADQVVSTTLVPTNGEAVRIDYVMRREAGTWKIVDVLLDGTISRVAVQRSDFRGVLAQGGAPALIASLERKVMDLAGSALES